MKGITHNEHLKNQDIFVQVPKNQFASNTFDKFQGVGLSCKSLLFLQVLFLTGFRFTHFSLCSDSSEYVVHFACQTVTLIFISPFPLVLSSVERSGKTQMLALSK